MVPQVLPARRHWMSDLIVQTIWRRQQVIISHQVLLYILYARIFPVKNKTDEASKLLHTYVLHTFEGR